MAGGAPKGNKNAWKGARARMMLESVLRKDTIDDVPDAPGWGNLRTVMKALVIKACGGDVPAIKEVFDRIDGKVTQPLDVKVDGDISLSDEERAARIASLLDTARARGAGDAANGEAVDAATGAADSRTTH